MLRNTLAYIRSAILSRYPEATPLEGGERIRHLLWMADELDSGRFDVLKYHRWIGWMLAMCEVEGLFDNNKSRELVRSDVEGTTA